MDTLFISALFLAPLVAWLAWLTGWSKNNNRLVVITAVAGLSLYVCSGYAIHSNLESWAEFLTRPEIEKIKNSEYDNQEELIETARGRGSRRVHSMTSLDLPFWASVWYAFVLLGGIAVKSIVEAIRLISSVFFRRGKRGS